MFLFTPGQQSAFLAWKRGAALVLVHGDAGCGKTAILAAIAATARSEGGRVLRGDPATVAAAVAAAADRGDRVEVLVLDDAHLATTPSEVAALRAAVDRAASVVVGSLHENPAVLSTARPVVAVDLSPTRTAPSRVETNPDAAFPE